MAHDPYRRHMRGLRRAMRKNGGNPYGMVIIDPVSVAEWRAEAEPRPRPTAAYTYCAVARVS